MCVCGKLGSSMLQGGGFRLRGIAVCFGSLAGWEGGVKVHACVCCICKPHLPHLRSAMGISPKCVCMWVGILCLFFQWPPLLHCDGDDGYAKLRSLETQTLGLNKNTHADTPRSTPVTLTYTQISTNATDKPYAHPSRYIYAHINERADAYTHPHDIEPNEAL